MEFETYQGIVTISGQTIENYAPDNRKGIHVTLLAGETPNCPSVNFWYVGNGEIGYYATVFPPIKDYDKVETAFLRNFTGNRETADFFIPGTKSQSAELTHLRVLEKDYCLYRAGLSEDPDSFAVLATPHYNPLQISDFLEEYSSIHFRSDTMLHAQGVLHNAVQRLG